MSLKKLAILNNSRLVHTVTKEWSLLIIFTFLLLIIANTYLSFNFNIYSNLLHIISIFIVNIIIILNLNNSYIFLNKILLFFCYLACSVMFIPSLFVESKIIHTSYIDIIDNIFFILGLSFFITISFVNSILIFFVGSKVNSSFNIFSKILSINLQLSFLLLMVSLYKINNILLLEYPIDLEYYYNILFYGYSYVLKFLYFNLIIMLTNIFIYKFYVDKEDNLSFLFCIINLLLSFFSLGLYFIYKVDSYYIESGLLQLHYAGYLNILCYFIYKFYFSIRYK